MSTEQAPEASEASIHERLASLAPEAAEEQPPVEAAEAADETAEPEVTPEEETFDFEDDDGKPRKLPADLKDYVLRRTDYTRKTTEAANLAKVAEDRMQYADMRDKVSEALSQKYAEVHSLKRDLEQFDKLDVTGLEPAQLWTLSQRRDALKAQLAQAEQQFGQGKQYLEQMAKQHAENQWNLANQGAHQRIGNLTPGENVAMAKLVQSMGFTEQELKGRFADPRFLHMVYKAAKWDVLQANKGKAAEKAASAPPVLKPGAAKPGAVAEQKYRDQRAKLKKSGDFKDAAKLFMF